MDINSIVYCILIGLCAGSLSGLVGIGGGIVMVPLMLLLFPTMTQYQAQGTTLAVLPASILSIWVYYKSGNVNVPIALMVCCGFMIGGFFGAKLAVSIPVHILKKFFAVCMFLISIKLFFSK